MGLLLSSASLLAEAPGGSPLTLSCMRPRPWIRVIRSKQRKEILHSKQSKKNMDIAEDIARGGCMGFAWGILAGQVITSNIH